MFLFSTIYFLTSKYNKYSCKERILIPKEIDRLEYLIRYCLKNYYIKNANTVPNGNYVPKWKLEHAVSSSSNDFNGHRDRIRDLEKEITELQDTIDEKSLLADISVTVNGEKYKII